MTYKIAHQLTFSREFKPCYEIMVIISADTASPHGPDTPCEVEVNLDVGDEVYHFARHPVTYAHAFQAVRELVIQALRAHDLPPYIAVPWP